MPTAYCSFRSAIALSRIITRNIYRVDKGKLEKSDRLTVPTNFLV
ncbi:MAG: hypothetical protein QNJ53_00515 [Pleurocapsa sp. MO_192.B19]|nr:hypothetical protein [Pleurocapsa sp. MO_192.B19]